MKPPEENSSNSSSRFLNTDGGKTKSNAIETPSISLPKGGGAIKGIDEKFSVNTVNDTASFSIPIPFSPTRGASPALGLSYNSGAGNGIFGLGWALSLPSIKRKTDNGLPEYLDGIDSDTFLFSEAEDLVPEFRKDADGSFSIDAVAHLRDYFSQDDATPSMRMFNLQQEFPNQWHNFIHPANPVDGNVYSLEMKPSLFPIRDKGKILKINTIWLLAHCTDKEGSYDVVMTPPLQTPPPIGSDTMTLTPSVNQYGSLHFSLKDVASMGIEIVPADSPVKWQLRMTRPGGGNLQDDEVEDVILVLGYEWE